MKPLVSLLVLFVCVATASAQMKAGFSRPMPTSAAVGLQQFLGSSAGAPLLAANPALLTVLGLDVSNPVHLQALGPLSARLPVDFAARAVADAGTARAVFSAAYSMSSNDAVGEIDAYARAVVMSAASDANAWRGLGSAASDLKSYSLYGEAARERVTLFAQKAATVRSQELAKGLSLELLAGLRGPESAAGGIPAGSVDKNSFARRNARLAPALAPALRLASAPGIGPPPEVQRQRDKEILESVKNADKPLPPGAIRIGVFVDGGGIGVFTGVIVDQDVREGGQVKKTRVIREALLEVNGTSRLLTRGAAVALAKRLGYQDVASVRLRKVPVWNPFPAAIKIFRERYVAYGFAIDQLISRVILRIDMGAEGRLYMPTIYPSPHSLNSYSAIVDSRPDGTMGRLVPRGQADNVVVEGTDIGLYHPDVSNGK